MSEKKKNDANTDVHLKSVRMAGFKNYLHPVELELGKVNFLLGPNGAGKSSFLQAIELMGILSAPKVLDGLALEDLSRFGTLQHISTGNLAEQVILASTIGHDEYAVELEVTLESRGKSDYRVCEWKFDAPDVEVTLGLGSDGQWYLRRLPKSKSLGLRNAAERLLSTLAGFDDVVVQDDALDTLCFISFGESLQERKSGYHDLGARWPNPRVVAIKGDVALCLTRGGSFKLWTTEVLEVDAWLDFEVDEPSKKPSGPGQGIGSPDVWSAFFGEGPDQDGQPSPALISMGLDLHAYYMHLSSVDILKINLHSTPQQSYPWAMAWMSWAVGSDNNWEEGLDGMGEQDLQGDYDRGALVRDVYRDFPLGRRRWQDSKGVQSSLTFWLGHEGPFGLRMSGAMCSAGHGVSVEQIEEEGGDVFSAPGVSDPLGPSDSQDPQGRNYRVGMRLVREMQGAEHTWSLQKSLFDENDHKSRIDTQVAVLLQDGIPELVKNWGLSIHHIGPRVEADFEDGGVIFHGQVDLVDVGERGGVECWIPGGKLFSSQQQIDWAKSGFEVLAGATQRFGWGVVVLEVNRGEHRVVMRPSKVVSEQKAQDTLRWRKGGSYTVADHRGDVSPLDLQKWNQPMEVVPVPMRLQGRGVRQVVAVALHLIRIACDGKSGAKVVALEEPTAFLHPRLASEFTGLIRELADVLGLTIIIETHNEYMIRQLSTDRLNGDNLEDVRIHYVGAQGDDYVLPIRVDRDGVFTPAIPEGFLDKSSAMQREQRQLKKKRGA